MPANNVQENHLPLPSAHLAHPKYRSDIDGLRAVAVLSVVAFHAFPSSVKGGFVGVDIFFVISGFLISTILFSSLGRGEFSFLEFYSRRTRRIFPALVTVLIACFAFGWFALLPDEYKRLGKHVAAGAGFVSNFVFWNESGYFDAAADTKPLLHLWSLGIEEQFYLAWPLLLWAAWKRRFNLLTITVAVAALSFTLNLATYQSNSVADFYSPQTRFWELLAGSLLAYITLHPSHSSFIFGMRVDGIAARVFSRKAAETNNTLLRDVQSIVGGLLITISVLRITKQKYFPGAWALLPVIGAVMVIAAGTNAWLNRRVLSSRVLVWFGLISFPLYLWHWPLLSFARIIEGQTPTGTIRLAALLISTVLAWITFKLVEHPLRFGGHNAAKVFPLLALMLLVGCLGYGAYRRDGLPSRKPIKDMERALSLIKWPDANSFDAVCKKRFGDEVNYCKSTNNKAPTVALIGDSFANSYFQGLSDEYSKVGDSLVMLGAPGCPPLLDISSSFPGQPDVCKSVDSRAIRQIATLSSVHTVILAANWHLYINGSRFRQHYGMPWQIRPAGAHSSQEDSSLIFSEKMTETIDFLAKAGKKILVMKQTPEIDLDPAACLIDRPLALRPNVKKCEQASAPVRAYLAEYEKTFDDVTKGDARVRVLDPYPILCPSDKCILMDGIYPVYRDGLHLSLYGSDYLASRLKLF